MKALTKSLTSIAMSLLFIANAASAQQAGKDEPISDEQKTIIIQKAIPLLRANYIFPERIDAIEARLVGNNRRHAYAGAHTLFAFLELFNKDLEQSGNDKHLDIFYGPQIVAKLKRDVLNNEKLAAPPEYLQMLAYENYRLRKVERMDGNIGYIKLNGFIELEHSREALSGAMRFIAHSSAIILDLRENGGGSAATANFLMSYFLPDSTLLGEFISRKEEATRLYTLREPGVPKLDVPLYILVSGRTSSAAEGVAYGLQQLKRATVIGEQTHGEANPGFRFPVNEKLYMMIPTAVNKNAVTGTNWDGVGVTPDMASEPDAALAAAVVKACKRLRQDGENDIYTWLLPEYEAQLHPQEPDEHLIQSIVGRYDGDRQIVREYGGCYYVNGKQKRRMSYMGNETFSLEGKREVRIAFTMNDNVAGNLKFLWNNGNADVVQRIQ